MKNIKKMKKGIILTTLAVVMFIVGATGVLAATLNNDAQDYATLRVQNKTTNGTNTGWSASASANAGEVVSFAIYYHNTGPDTATNVRVRLTPQTTGVGTNQSFNAYVWADNASQVTGGATVSLSSSQSISFSSGSVVWRPNQTISGSQALPNGQNGSEIFSSNGLLLGNITSGWSTQGSVVLSFNVANATKPTVTTNNATSITATSARLNCFIDPNGDANTTRWFEYGRTQSLGSRTNTINHGSTASSVTEFINGLSSNTNYYFRCSAQNSSGVVNGSIVSFYTGNNGNQNLSVTTSPVSGVSSNFAVLNGNVNPNGDTNISRWFEYGTNSWSFSNSTSKIGQGTNASNFSDTISGLITGTTYYYRAVARGSMSGTVYGNIQSFRTNGNSGQRPFVTTNNATSIFQNTATLNGYVNPYNVSNTTRWFEYGRTQSLGSRTNTINHGSTSANISDTLSGLSNNTIYYYRAVARNSYGTSYGSILNFTTGVGSTTSRPIAITNLATNIDNDSARLNGLAILSGGSPITSGWFEWGRSRSLGRTTRTNTLGTAPSISARASLFGLSSNATYYYRFVAQNQNGIDRGNILNFRTNSVVVIHPVPGKTRKISITKMIENLSTPNGMNTRISALRGEKARFTITVENTGDFTLQNVVIKDRIPFYLEFANADEINSNNPRREVVWEVGDMSVGERQSVTLDVIVTGNARIGDVIENVARVESKRITQNSNVASISVVGNNVAIGNAGNKQNTASTFFGGTGLWGTGFLPNTLIGWLFIVLLIFTLVVLSRKLYDTKKDNIKK